MLNLLNEDNDKKQISKLVKTVKKYQNQTITISSLIEDNLEDSFKLQLFDKAHVVITEGGMCFKGVDVDDNTNGNIIEFSFDNMKDTYIDILDIFKDIKPEVHVMFNYKEKRYSIINLV